MKKITGILVLGPMLVWLMMAFTIIPELILVINKYVVPGWMLQLNEIYAFILYKVGLPSFFVGMLLMWSRDIFPSWWTQAKKPS